MRLPWAYHINESACNHCDACRKICSECSAIYQTKDENYIISQQMCNQCGKCMVVCQNHAVAKTVYGRRILMNV